jgi:glucose/arabinose dehydrogenase
VRLVGLAALVALAFIIPNVDRPSRVSSGPGEGGFVAQTLYDNLPNPVAFQFAPDGRIFIATRSGDIRIIKDGTLLPDPFATFATNTAVVRGVLGMVLDPAFADNGYVYVYYTYENNPAEPYGAKTQRLVRLTADGDVAEPGSELVLLGTTVGNLAQTSCDDFPAATDCIPADGVDHMGGGLKFAPDGSLFLSTGDAARTLGVPPLSLLLRSQDLDGLAGKVLRIDPATGAGLSDNPFFTGDATANRSKVWSYGFRNPFRLWIDDESGLPIVGEVGSRLWEEVNLAKPGENYGWPCYEGAARQPDFIGNAYCDQHYSSNQPVEHPLYAYANVGGAALIGGLVYDGDDLPVEYEGAYFFADFVRQTVGTLQIDDDGQLVDGSVQEVLSDAGFPVDFEIGPDGRIYYLTLDPSTFVGDLRVLEYIEGNRTPIAMAHASTFGGPAPLSVSFSSVQSSDPDGDALSYLWDFGDGQTSTAPSPGHSFVQNGTYAASLTVSDPGGASDVAQLTIIVGNSPPKANIITPVKAFSYAPGATIAYSGSGTDAEDGALAANRLSWLITMKHCYVSTKTCHTHPFGSKTGAGGSINTPSQDPGEIMYVVFSLTAKDSAGLTNTVTYDVGQDSDADGLIDADELLLLSTDYLDSDSDDDGVIDGAEDADGDTCPNARELSGSVLAGGWRNPLNPYDYFNPSRDGHNRNDDVLLVLYQYYDDDNDVSPGSTPFTEGYSPSTDRTFVGPRRWDLGPPNGLQRIDDILNQLGQYLHDCA